MRLQNGVHGLGRLALPKSAVLRDAIDELVLRHDFPPCRGQLTGRNVTTHSDESSLNSAPGAEMAASSEPFQCSGARNGHFSDQYRRGLDTAPEGHPAHLGAHGAHRFQHRNEVAGDGQLAHGGAQLAPLDEPSGWLPRRRFRTPGSRPSGGPPRPSRRARRPRAAPGRRGPRRPARSPGWWCPTDGGERYEPRLALPVLDASRLARGARVVEEAEQAAVLDQAGPARAHALAVEGGAGRSVGRRCRRRRGAARGRPPPRPRGRRTASGRAGRRRRTASSR